MKRQRDTERERERRKEGRVLASFPLNYYFIHVSENRNTKSFRRGVTCNISPHGIFFEADVVDPDIIPAALQGDIQIAIRVRLPNRRRIEGSSRLVWHEPVPETGGKRFLIGVEYIDVSDADARELFEAAKAAS